MNDTEIALLEQSLTALRDVVDWSRGVLRDLVGLLLEAHRGAPVVPSR
jgi:hypothetical protein